MIAIWSGYNVTGSHHLEVDNKERQITRISRLVTVVLLFIFSQPIIADVATQLDWDSVTWTAGSTNQSYAIGSGNVSINFNGATDTPPGDAAALVNTSPLITTDLTGGLGPVQDALEINVDYAGGSSQVIPIIIDFTHPGGVSDVSFSIFDVDQGGWTDIVQVQATTDGITYFNPTTIVSSASNVSDGVNTVTGNAGATETSAAGTATFSFTNSGITQVRILYSNASTAFQWVALHDINFTYPESDLAITKSHVGNFNEGSAGTYTLSVSNDASASDEVGTITVTDTLPTGISFVSATGAGWTCGAVIQDVTCTHPGPLAAGNSLPNITLNVLAGSAAVPSVINTANVSGTLPDSNAANNSSSDSTTVIGSPAITPGNKPLYLYSDTGADTDPDLSRSPPSTAQTNIRIRKNVELSETWVITPQTQSALVIDGSVATIPVDLILRKGGTSGSSVNRSIQVALSTSLGVIGSQTRNLVLNGTPTNHTFSIPISGDINLPAGSTISMTVTNVTPVSNNATFRVFPVSGGNNSQIGLTSETVINVDSVQFYDAPYPGGSLVGSLLPGTTVYTRAVVSDPFGSFDISNADIDITDANGTPVVIASAMTEVADSGVATKTYEFAHAIPGGGPLGTWNVVVTANEGTEGIVSDNAGGSFVVGGTPDVILLKTTQVLDDGIGNVAPVAKAIPGATILYRLAATNQGNGATDNNLSIEDPIPANTSLCVADPCAQGLDPIRFTDAPIGTISSGLTYNFASDVEFSKSIGPGFVYGATLTPDGNGYDSAVTSIRVRPSGTFDPASGGAPAGFEIQFRVQVQ